MVTKYRDEQAASEDLKEKADPASPYLVLKMCAWLVLSTSGCYDHDKAVETNWQRRRAKIITHRVRSRRFPSPSPDAYHQRLSWTIQRPQGWTEPARTPLQAGISSG